MSERRFKRAKATRGALVAAIAGSPLAAGRSGGPLADSLVVHCSAFLAADRRIRGLLTRWAALESAAAKTHDWFKLTRTEQLELPQGREMAEIDEMIPGLVRQREALLAQLPAFAAIDPIGVAAKLAAATNAIDPEDHREVHQLLMGATSELSSMRCPRCRQPLLPPDWIDQSLLSPAPARPT